MVPSDLTRQRGVRSPLGTTNQAASLLVPLLFDVSLFDLEYASFLGLESDFELASDFELEGDSLEPSAPDLLFEDE